VTNVTLAQMAANNSRIVLKKVISNINGKFSTDGSEGYVEIPAVQLSQLN
jgi:hypothetical protein